MPNAPQARDVRMAPAWDEGGCWGAGCALERARHKGRRAALFQVVSILIATGYVTQDSALWYPLPQCVLVILMFVGGCTGSTASGLRVARIALLGRVVGREFRRMAEPQGVFTVRLSGEPISEVAGHGLLNLVYLAWMLNLLASRVLTATGVDIVTTITAVGACVFNVGPGLAGVGPLESSGNLPGLAKWVLAFCMIAGRIESYTLRAAALWRRAGLVLLRPIRCRD